MSNRVLWFAALYVGACVAANLAVYHLGPSWAPLIAFFLIGFDLVSRDEIHSGVVDRRRSRTANGFAFIFGIVCLASAITYYINAGAHRIAYASALAFAASGIVDTLVFHLLRDKPWIARSNGSNFAAAIVDSVIFPTLAFGAFMPLIIVGQSSAKILGGLGWSYVILRLRGRKDEQDVDD